MEKAIRIINGQKAVVTICPPSRRRLGGIQKKRYQRLSAGARHVAIERGLITTGGVR